MEESQITSNERKLTVEQAADALNVSRATIYNWIKTNKIRFRESPKGKIIHLTQEEIDAIEEYNLINSTPEILSQSNIVNQDSNNSLDVSKLFLDKIRSQDNKVLLGLLDQVKDLNTKIFDYNDKLLYYSEQAGQVKLLTDNSKFYQEEYFKQKYELENLIKLNKELEKENIVLKDELEILTRQIKKNRWHFWGA